MTQPGRPVLATVLTVAIACLGGAVFAAVGMPVPWLSGAMITVAGLAMAEKPVEMIPAVRDLGLLLAGVSLGATVTPDAIHTIVHYPFSLIGMCLAAAATVATSRTILERVYGWDRPTAFLAAVPGALSMVMALAAASSGDVRRIAVVQAIRLFALVMVMPLAVNATMPAMTPPNPDVIGAGDMALLFAAAFALGALMHRLHFASPLFMGGLSASTGLHIANILPGQLPPPLIIGGLVLVGVFAGLRFEGATPRQLVRCLAPGLISLSVALGISFAIAYIVYLATGLKLAEVLVAFAPGGLEAMVMLGASMGLDTLFISTHHVVRTMALNVVTPFFAPSRRGDRS